MSSGIFLILIAIYFLPTLVGCVRTKADGMLCVVTRRAAPAALEQHHADLIARGAAMSDNVRAIWAALTLACLRSPRRTLRQHHQLRPFRQRHGVRDPRLLWPHV